MQLKKIAASVAAAALAFGICTAVPFDNAGFGGISINASAAENGFVIRTDDDGFKYVADYTGKGGAVRIPQNVDYIGAEAFFKNEDITSLTVPANCTVVGENAFAGCTKLKTVTFDGDIEAIYQSAFMLCSSLESVTFKGDVHSIYSNSDDFYGGIFDYAFSVCYNLRTVTFAENSQVDFIGAFAFADDFNLSSVRLPNKIREIHRGAFSNCERLSNVSLPASVEFIEPYAFGYMFDEDIQEWTRATGSNHIEIQIIKYNPQNNDYYYEDKTITQRQITLTVDRNSRSEEYAKGYDIKYKYRAQEKLAAPVNIEASAGTGKVTLTWDSVNGADAYRVYIYNSSTEKYEKYKDISGEKCTVKGLKSGRKYRFKVAALEKSGGKYKAGKISEAVSASAK